MIKKHVLIGFLIGLLTNAAGIFFYILIFSKMDLEATIQDALQNDYLGKIIALGAILNFFPFFVFIKKNLLYKARGVLLATVLTAVVIAVTKFI
ncbi:hypothetical protein [Gillisia hiemivivida]|uniref:Uncharacterized protein n=1 Tax=Gillisia hiemivivida TaxID=291190 RepID=A0A5C6ZRI5_9FLAO|nr:hypothetical protein [Gillisia hiemivivida]TXD92947.1 hypothetical protein ES724_11900 [Gillisia hiemivivida]